MRKQGLNVLCTERGAKMGGLRFSVMYPAFMKYYDFYVHAYVLGLSDLLKYGFGVEFHEILLNFI